MCIDQIMFGFKAKRLVKKKKKCQRSSKLYSSNVIINQAKFEISHVKDRKSLPWHALIKELRKYNLQFNSLFLVALWPWTKSKVMGVLITAWSGELAKDLQPLPKGLSSLKLHCKSCCAKPWWCGWCWPHGAADWLVSLRHDWSCCAKPWWCGWSWPHGALDWLVSLWHDQSFCLKSGEVAKTDHMVHLIGRSVYNVTGLIFVWLAII